MSYYLILLALFAGFIGGIVGSVLVAWYSVALKRQTEEKSRD